ncbi:MAG TPA: phosphatase PAP2 family protein [Planctomycetota bacterium]|nr:phosphatase PAP2 family protein [Planctomycetota bacterium]
MKKLYAFDLVNLGYLALLSLVVLILRPAGSWIFLLYHALAAVMIGLVAHAYHRYGGNFWSFFRYWYVVPFALGAFRECYFLVPLVHPFEDHYYDRVLQHIDRRWFGDVDAFFLNGWPTFLYDFLHLCYWFYFISLLIPGAVIHLRGQESKLRQYLAVTMVGLLTSYLGYYVVPAIGPHHFFTTRPRQLDGLLIGGPMHQMILAAEWRTPDAFPSGHALLSMVVIYLSWKLCRPAFRIVVAPALGCILATMALRYHYVIDVVTSVTILPGVLLGGTSLHRWWDGDDKPAAQDCR